MRTDAVYNLSGYWEAPRAFKQKQDNIKIDITKCHIIYNEFGYFDLYLGPKKIKRLSLEEYLKLRAYVNRIEWRDDNGRKS